MKLTSAFCATGAVVLLSGCAYDTTPVAIATPAPAVVATAPAVVATAPAVVATGPAVVATAPAVVASNSIFYDQFYGQILSGFWGSDALFHYQLVANGPWLIDTGRHFRHEASTGFTVVSIAPPVSGAIVAATPAGPGASVFYDSFYGPIYTGYWGAADGLFHYQLVTNGPWLIDRARHFRRNAATGFAVVTLPTVAIPPA